MKIVVEELYYNENYYENLNLVDKRVYEFKLDFVKTRLAVLNDDLMKEETNNPKACIQLRMSGKTVSDFITIKGYSTELSNKIKDYVAKETAYFENGIFNIVHATLN